MKTIEEQALRMVTRDFNDFIAACVDEQGNPKAPSKAALAMARASIPRGYSMAYQKVTEQKSLSQHMLETAKAYMKAGL